MMRGCVRTRTLMEESALIGKLHGEKQVGGKRAVHLRGSLVSSCRDHLGGETIKGRRGTSSPLLSAMLPWFVESAAAYLL
jgi:hypothetical protein